MTTAAAAGSAEASWFILKTHTVTHTTQHNTFSKRETADDIFYLFDPQQPICPILHFSFRCARTTATTPMPLLDGFRTNKNKSIPPWILCCAVVAATVVCVCVVVGLRLCIPNLKGSSLRPSAARSVSFELDLITVDPMQQILTLDWWIIGDDCNDSGSTVGTSQNTSCSIVNIYVNLYVFPGMITGYVLTGHPGMSF